ncbi:MAG TPA: hypothetical protein VIW95_08765 [Candidatus Binatus sp.]|jgi:hypothetical protein|uniref:hypothetical protein n=1 Tax=Candidatus Binatus sp. TaxID=2811406 RepID=UPI002F3FCD0E
MRLRNQRSLARLKRIDRLLIRQLAGVLSLALVFLAGCASGTPGTTRLGDLLGTASPTPSPSAAPTVAATPAPIATPVAEETTGHAGRKTATQARAASENAAIASKEAANASAAAALASKQAASVANRIEGAGPSNADVSLESNPATTTVSTPASTIRNRATPVSSPSLAMSDPSRSPAPRISPTLNTPGLESPSQSGESNPAKAAKLIQNVDSMERRIDRKNLSADDSQRDILAQKLLQEAKKALADRDSVAAISLATKASTLFAPLPKLADSTIPSTP